MLNENNRQAPDNVRTAEILTNPDVILKIENPSERQQIVAVQKKPELIAHLPFAGEKVQLSAVIVSAESVLLINDPTPTACFMAVEGMLGINLLPDQCARDAAKRLVLQMKKDKAEGKPGTAAIEKFLTEVKPFKN